VKKRRVVSMDKRMKGGQGEGEEEESSEQGQEEGGEKESSEQGFC
jgi:hypothetical protein